METARELPYIKSFGLVSVTEIFSNIFQEKNTQPNTKAFCFSGFLKWEVFSPLS